MRILNPRRIIGFVFFIMRRRIGNVQYNWKRFLAPFYTSPTPRLRRHIVDLTRRKFGIVLVCTPRNLSLELIVALGNLIQCLIPSLRHIATSIQFELVDRRINRLDRFVVACGYWHRKTLVWHIAIKTITSFLHRRSYIVVPLGTRCSTRRKIVETRYTKCRIRNASADIGHELRLDVVLEIRDFIAHRFSRVDVKHDVELRNTRLK